ncbi:MAG TPA: sugar transferase [Bryobacteraceae bacterium]|nr:sugar transferase [Bryobacteraceae bacterium]
MATIPLVRQQEPIRALSWQTVGFTERVAATLMLALAAPVLLASGLLLSLFSRRSPLIAHKRVGWRGSPLWVLKLRTMWDGTASRELRAARWVEYIDDEAGPDLKEAGDPRVPNAFARFCRRHSIDEIPQLWHVVSGEMSLVGPRPMTAAELERYYGPDAGEILQVKPGLAGLWQVSGRNRLTYAQRRALDLQLVRTRSIRLYLLLLLRTIPEVLGGANSW